MKNGIVALVALAGLASGASATNTWQVKISYDNGLGYVDAGSGAKIQIWAGFDDNLYAFAGALLDINTDEAGGSWSAFGRDLKGPGTKDGVASGGNVLGALPGQLHFPPGGIFADTSNPILAWHGTFNSSGPYDNHVAQLTTKTSKYNVYINADGTSQDFIKSLIEGAGGIQIGPVPTPATAALLGLGALAAGRRRR
jgi:uncharacterized protein (TIGR03382 family)